jgi:SpoVK/Ycf46/Vps4 family AAA+-type ATPase
MGFTSIGTWWLFPAVSYSCLLWCDRFQLRSDVSLKDVVSLLPDKLTGADLYSVCSNAWAIALRTHIHNLVHGIYSVAVVPLSRVEYYS